MVASSVSVRFGEGLCVAPASPRARRAQVRHLRLFGWEPVLLRRRRFAETAPELQPAWLADALRQHHPPQPTGLECN